MSEDIAEESLPEIRPPHILAIMRNKTYLHKNLQVIPFS